MKVLITGGAGFIGSHLVDRFIAKGDRVVVIDNLSSGHKEFLSKHTDSLQLLFIERDLLDDDTFSHVPSDIDIVFHFAANANVKKGIEQTDLDIQQGVLATHAVLEFMRKKGIKKIVFPSSMTVYGNVPGISFAEDFGPCQPISLYASAKLSAEALISAYSHTFTMQAWIFRFANVIGDRLTHGVIFDLIRKLHENPEVLHILGDGSQTKPYVAVEDVVEAIFFSLDKSQEKVNLFNIGVEDTISVKEIVGRIIHFMNLSPKLVFDSHPEGWVGDVTKCMLDVTKLKKLGYTSQYNSLQAVDMTIQSLLQNI